MNRQHDHERELDQEAQEKVNRFQGMLIDAWRSVEQRDPTSDEKKILFSIAYGLYTADATLEVPVTT